MFFNLNFQIISLPSLPTKYTKPSRIDWSKANDSHEHTYCDMLSNYISPLPPEITSCVLPGCKRHQTMLDNYAQSLINSLLQCAHDCFPSTRKRPGRRLVGWNNCAVDTFKKSANLWYKIWNEAGCPSSGVLHQIKKSTKSRYKYEIRRLKRKQSLLLPS